VLFQTRWCQWTYSNRRRGEGSKLTEVKVRENESIDNALKRFKRQCALTGVLSEVRKREHYEKPSVKRKKKAEAARRKKNKKARR